MQYKVIEINQPLGTFYVFKISAYNLLNLVESKPYAATLEGEKYNKKGVQRRYDKNRGKEISRFLQGAESALPNSIIIAGNTNKDLPEEEKWSIVLGREEGCQDYYLDIPKVKINGSIIDGQHRLYAFRELSEKAQKDYELICALYLDLPNPIQAYIFATINMNQRKVDKGLAYELYGYDIDDVESDDVEPENWSPEKLAVYLTRKLNFDKESVFHEHILLIADSDVVLEKYRKQNSDWVVSTSAIVEGILSLISSKPKMDRDLLQIVNHENRKRNVLRDVKSYGPLREFYLDANDQLIYSIINNFFKASHTSLYEKDGILFKTVGIQVQFIVLKKILEQLNKDKDIRVSYFQEQIENYFDKVENIDFTDNFFQLSGIGKTRMKNTLLIAMGLMNISEIKNENELIHYKRILNLD